MSHYIPCLHKPYFPGSSKIMIYFHANAEDAVRSKDLIENLRIYLQVHMIAMEYPGYGIFQ